jgi:hypothetical protein
VDLSYLVECALGTCVNASGQRHEIAAVFAAEDVIECVVRDGFEVFGAALVARAFGLFFLLGSKGGVPLFGDVAGSVEVGVVHQDVGDFEAGFVCGGFGFARKFFVLQPFDKIGGGDRVELGDGLHDVRIQRVGFNISNIKRTTWRDRLLPFPIVPRCHGVGTASIVAA